MRDSDFESSLREFRITSAGFELDRTFDSAEAILSGFPHRRARNGLLTLQLGDLAGSSHAKRCSWSTMSLASSTY
jgi:hypothetical protein